MYKTTVKEFLQKISPDYNYHGFDAGAIYGQPGKLFVCILADGSRVYAGLIAESETLLAITHEEHSSAFMAVSDELEKGHHFPHGVKNEPYDLYKRAILDSAWELIESVSYWLGKEAE